MALMPPPQCAMHDRSVMKSSDPASAASHGTADIRYGRVRQLPSELADLRGWVVILCIAVLGFSFLGARGLWEPDEGRYSAVALNMLATGDYLIPRLNPEQPHFAKPPLTYWAVAASIETFGRTEWAVRLPAALAYTMTALVVALLATLLGLRRPLMTAAIWATTLLPFVAASLITADMLLTLFESIVMLGYLQWRLRGSSRALWLMWLALAAAFMTKGPPALLPLLAVMVFELSRGRDGRLRGLFRIAPLLAFILLAFWWFAYVISRDPSLARYFLVEETFERVASNIHDRNPGWKGLVSVYGTALFAGTQPFAPLLLWALVRGRNSAPAWRPQASAGVPLVFLYFWMAVPFAVFALSQSRLPFYLLPLTVPFALATSMHVDRAGIPTRVVRNLAILGTLLLLGLRFASTFWETGQDSRALAHSLAAHESLWHYDQILFVDRSRPAYGLEFYTGKPVGALWTGSTGLCTELERARSPLILVSQSRMEAFTREAEKCWPAPLVALGPVAQYGLFAKVPGS
jgi:4-amino-4-deoxy-L-arabinose transferase